jgi:hypothetical protein
MLGVSGLERSHAMILLYSNAIEESGNSAPFQSNPLTPPA